MKIIRFITTLVAVFCAQAFGQTSDSLVLANISGRGDVDSGTPLIAGFVVTSPRRVLIRAAGPGIPRVRNYCKNPVLTVFKGSSSLAVNDNWDSSQEMRDMFIKVGAFPFAPDSPDCAITLNLEPGDYTAVVTCSAGDEGVALVEVYEIPSRLQRDETGVLIESRDQGTLLLSGFINLSLRGRSSPGEKILIAGFVMRGQGRSEYLLRAIGPGLERHGIPDFLPDPKIIVRNESGVTLAEWDNPGPRDTALILTGLTTGASATSQFSITVTAEDTEGRSGIVLLEANDRLFR